MEALLFFAGYVALTLLVKWCLREPHPNERYIATERRRAKAMARERRQLASYAAPHIVDYMPAPPKVYVDKQGRRWQQITTATREPFDTGEHAGTTISAHLQWMLSDD
jgi:hypothetical protein